MYDLTIRVDVDSKDKDCIYVAYIDNERYKGIVESGNTLSECLSELAKSVFVKEEYDKQLKTTNDAN